MTKGVIDRLEGNIAVIVLENGETMDLTVNPAEIYEGLCVTIENGKIIATDPLETTRRKKAADERLQRLLNRNV